MRKSADNTEREAADHEKIVTVRTNSTEDGMVGDRKGEGRRRRVDARHFLDRRDLVERLEEGDNSR